jgi:ABC-2 type transport system ATP-binding protein
MMTDDLAVEVCGLTKSYGADMVLRGIDLSVPRGTVYALLGPNGAGKTTTVRILSTLTKADAGTVRVAGFDVRAARSEVRLRISLTGQEVTLDGLQTGVENLQMMARLRGLPPAAARVRATELLEMLDLLDAANRRVATYSGGMRRRLDLAAGLVTRPEVIFLDEPTTGLDPRGRQGVWDVVRELAASGVTILLTTQYLEEADQLADRIAVLDGGTVVAEGTAAELKQRVAGRRLDIELVSDGAFTETCDYLGVRAVRADQDARTVGVTLDGTAREARALLDEIDPDGTRVADFAVRTASLDDVFFALTGHAAALESSDV